MASRSVAVLQDQLEASTSRHSVLQDEGEERLSVLTQQLATRDAELAHLMGEKERLAQLVGKEKEERERLVLVIADLELAKDNLTHKLSTCETTIHSLRSQVSLTESGQQLREEERAGLEERVAVLSEQLTVLHGQLEAANDRLLEQERAKTVLELAGTERLDEIRNLTRTLEEVRLRAESAGELQDRVDQLERDLGRKQEEVRHPHYDLLLQCHCFSHAL